MMAVGNEKILEKMMMEVQQAKQLQNDHHAMLAHIQHIRLLCDLFLDDEETPEKPKRKPNDIEEVEMKASKVALRNQAIIESAKLPTAKKVEIIQILTNKGMRKQSDLYIEVEMDKLVESNPAKVLELIKADKTETAIHAMILEGIEKNVLRKEGTSIYYMDDQLGYDIFSAINYFKDPSNQKLKAEILDKLK